MEATRDGFGRALLELGERDKRVVVCCADLAESTRVLAFKEKYPGRYIELGVAEQNLATIGSGLANYGKIPFICSYAAFNPGRNNEQIRTTISLNNVPVKIAGMHAGVSVGPDGATHQALEDIALMRVQPNMVVLSPCDSEEAYKATLAAAAHPGPVYLRFAREKTPVITTPDTPFEIGKAWVAWESEHSPEVAIFATGPLLAEALEAAKKMEHALPAVVINIHTIKPLDREHIVEHARAAGAVVVVEEHQVAGGLGGAVAECLSEEYPVPIEFVGIKDRFGQSGEPKELIAYYGMDAAHIEEAAKKAAGRKKSG
ncbi:transketolase [Candidatus Adlerbacteria bacterium RIFCSPHIGHO2_02_FULL_54_18]|uniref:Transketolase n=2 Tax=Candidatus Adleribacteriota TaxID=1752736 RepID=A0A1F4Y337_9BACT|nr:MAG: transketolase [Candidatus Adlerbacteria bacterium RIFCSPLOWO2_01_FULL_54_21b]OGC88284.1 MAG: transketolase [Candidatus Adlerbacteria bacterium RIFCSPHIGHO2_02_FULL_54_18]